MRQQLARCARRKKRKSSVRLDCETSRHRMKTTTSVSALQVWSRLVATYRVFFFFFFLKGEDGASQTIPQKQSNVCASTGVVMTR